MALGGTIAGVKNRGNRRRNIMQTANTSHGRTHLNINRVNVRMFMLISVMDATQNFSYER